jgi:long-chain acyl-CoA synthetase
MISPLFKSLEIKYQLRDSDSKFLIVWEGFDGIYGDYGEFSKQTGIKTIIHSSLGNWFVPDPTLGDAVSADGSTLYLEDMIRTTKPNPPKVTIDVMKDLANLQYTGGTTGMPKGGMLSHFNIVANLHQIKPQFPDCELGKEVMLMALPLYHIYAQTMMNYSVMVGANIVLVANPREAEELIEAIEKHKVTVFPGVAAMFNNVNNYPDIKEKNLRSIKYCFSSAGPLPKEVQDRFEKLTGSKLREAFGLTEASPVVTVNPLAGRFKNGTVGLPVSNTDIKIVDIETGTKVLGVNEVGELCAKGPQVFQGYYKKPEENKKTIRDGWLYTGDAALIDDEGYTVIKERLKNMLKYKGHSVYPTEVEALLFEHPAILDCAVIGIKDPTVGENIKAFVVLKSEHVGKVKEGDIIDWAKKNMAQYKAPHIVEFIEEIPKSRIGKVLHRILRDGKTEMD